MMKTNERGQPIFAGDEVYSIDCTGDACIGDEVRFSRAIWSGNYPKAKFIENLIVEGTIINDSYGAAEQQHTFTLQYENGKVSLIKGRNLYENGIWRKRWLNEKAREVVLKNKHDRGREARAVKAYNTMTRGEKIEYKQKVVMTPDNIPQAAKFNPVIKDPKEVQRYACKGCGEMKLGTEYTWRKPKGATEPHRDPYCQRPCRAAFLIDGRKKAAQAKREQQQSLAELKTNAQGKRIFEGKECVEKMEFIKVAKGVSYHKLADLLGVNLKSVMNWRHGRNLPRHDMQEKIHELYEETKKQPSPAPTAPKQNLFSSPQNTPPMQTQAAPPSTPQPPAQMPAEAGPSGWRCPSCRRVWAPHVDACKDCK